jgi:hypothetical protein
MDLPYDPAIPLLGRYPKEMKSAYNRDTCAPIFNVAPSTKVKVWNRLRCPITGEWTKIWYVYTMRF